MVMNDQEFVSDHGEPVLLFMPVECSAVIPSASREMTGYTEEFNNSLMFPFFCDVTVLCTTHMCFMNIYALIIATQERTIKFTEVKQKPLCAWST